MKEPPAASSSPLIRHLATRGYVFDDLLIASFYGGLKAKGFVILSGLSGTGKTKLAQELATFLGSAARMLLVPVRPDWRDSSGLLGSWNPITQSYESTGFLRFVREAAKDWSNRRKAGHPRAHIVVLDEMNLSRVEYYFAELLSVLETGRDEEGFTREAITLPGPAEVGPSPLRLPPNLYLVGTVNMDETTFSFSPKVLDRAYTIELRDVDLRNYPPGRAGESPVEPDERERVARDLARGGRFTWFGKQDVAAWGLRRGHLVRDLADLNGRLEPHDLHFGYRVVDEVLAFVAALDQTSACPMPERDAFDAAVAMKVLPKFHGTRHRLERPLQAVVDWAGPEDVPRYPATWRKADRMLTRARTLGHASFA